MRLNSSLGVPVGVIAIYDITGGSWNGCIRRSRSTGSTGSLCLCLCLRGSSLSLLMLYYSLTLQHLLLLLLSVRGRIGDTRHSTSTSAACSRRLR